MEFNQFVDEVKGGIKQFLPIEYEDAQVRIEEVKKLNENYLGITVLKENQVIAPTFNLNQLYKMYQSDPEVSMGSILRSITELVLDVPEQFNPKSITEYENAKKKLFIRVSSAEKNEEMLQNVPHQMREDLAITYHLAIRIDDIGVGSTTITNDILKRYGISEEQLHADAIGAGDQGMMFGYATNETKTYMPYPIELAHKLALQLTKVRKEGVLPYLRPDGKTQVTVEYDEKDKPLRLDAVVLSTQHDPEITQEQIQLDIKKYVFDEILPGGMVDENTKFYINPTGRFVIGGPHGDSGLTGRKIIVDTYGGYARHGGGAFSGKDCTKVDRSASYAARYAAKNIVASGLAEKCEVQLSYAIGVAQPTSIMVDTFGTGKLSDERITEIVRENFDFRPAGIIKELTLRRPIYRQTAAYGHFGREDLDLPWERLDKVNELKKYL